MMIRTCLVDALGVIQSVLCASDEALLELNTPDDLTLVPSVPDDLAMRWNGTEWVPPG